MIRRQTRLRKEYLYRKALEDKEKSIHERKSRLKAAISAGKSIPTELRHEEAALRHEIEMEDSQTQQVRTHIDDEYAFAGVKDPKVVITTARDPSSRLAMFAKEMKLLFPNAQRLNRGNYIIKDLISACRSNDVTDLIMLHEHRGQPDGMVICHLPYGPTAYFSLQNVVMRHDLKEFTSTMSEQFPHLIFNNFSSTLGQRVQSILKYLYPVPKEESTRVMTFSNTSDYVSFRHHTYKKDGKNVELQEVGPRFEMKVYQIKLGTVDQTEADTEWVSRPYLNTARKKNYLYLESKSRRRTAPTISNDAALSGDMAVRRATVSDGTFVNESEHPEYDTGTYVNMKVPLARRAPPVAEPPTKDAGKDDEICVIM